MLLSIVVPCFNESENAASIRDSLLPVLARLRPAGGLEIIFVDDGSTDGTLPALKTFLGESGGFHYLRHERNSGIGAALRTGFRAAKGDVIVTTDSDGTYRFEEIPSLLDALKGADIATASPYHPDGSVEGVPSYRLALSKTASALYRRATGLPLHTFTSLFRAYRREALDRIPFRSNGFVSVAEIMVLAAGAGMRIAEVPMTLHARQRGVSKMRTMRVAAAHVPVLLSAAFRRMTPS